MNPPAETSLKRSGQAAWIEVRSERLLQNLETLRRLAGPETAVMAVVKANAYGHGLVQTAKALAGRVDYFGVSSVAEALTLKEHLQDTPIFLFGRFFPEELPPVLSEGITLTVSSYEEAREIEDLSASLGLRTRVHVKVDTGMGRMGLPCRDSVDAIEQMAGLTHLELEGIYTHFPTAEAEDDFAARQLADFARVIRDLEKKGLVFRYRHAQNSAGIVRIREPLLNMARPGLMLYGVYPAAGLETLAPVSPALSLKSRIHFIKPLRAGESAGYGRTFVAKQATRIGILPIGYSHGYPWAASGKSQVLIRGKRFPVAGRVSMDYLAVDLGEDSIAAGEEVTLLGKDGRESVRAEELAAWAGTISYEILTQLAPKLPRLYV